ncbi:oxidoreductase [Streptomyces sp. NPDC059917]|uniref:oxidoreductase n=1 Tax=Streptomyces sp. NPDC059917 TaxID=3347002 RepID=UPI003656738F
MYDGPQVRAEELLERLGRPTGGRVGLVPRGARVTGSFDLTALTVDRPIVIEDCWFEAPVVLTDARLRGIRLSGCRMPRLEGDRVVVDGLLDLERIRCPSGIRLDAARLFGGLRLVGAALGPHADGDGDAGGATGAGAGAAWDGTAWAGAGIELVGPLEAAGMRATGGVLLGGARLGAVVDLIGARIERAGADALVLDRAVLGERLLAQRLRVDGRMRLYDATVSGSVHLSGARLHNPGGIALGAAGVTVRGGFWCEESFTARGEVRLVGAELRANLSLVGASLDHPGGNALDLGNAAVGEVDARALEVHRGGVSLRGAVIRHRLDLTGARFAPPGSDPAAPPDPITPLDLRLLQAGEVALCPEAPVRCAVALDHARIGHLHDDPAAWPAELVLDGLVYEALSPVLPAARRLAWLALDGHAFRPQPYEQLAAAYARSGLPDEARAVQYAKQRRSGRARTGPARIWGAVQDALVGYGYRPWRALCWLVLVVAGCGTVFAARPPAPLEPGKGPGFNGFAYALDLVLPWVDLGQEQAFVPVGATRWLAFALIGTGWILASVIAAAVARSVARG